MCSYKHYVIILLINQNVYINNIQNYYKLTVNDTSFILILKYS